MDKQQNYSPMIGVDMFHYAHVDSDIIGDKTTYKPSKRVPGQVSAGFNPNSSIATFYADNGPYESAAQTGNLQVDLDMADLPPSLLAEFNGGSYKDGLYEPVNTKYPDLAVAYRIKKANGHYRYYWFYKGKITTPSSAAETQKENVTYQSSKFIYSAVNRLSDGKPYRVLDTDDPNLKEGLTPEIIEQVWFEDPNWDLTIPEVPAP